MRLMGNPRPDTFQLHNGHILTGRGNVGIESDRPITVHRRRQGEDVMGVLTAALVFVAFGGLNNPDGDGQSSHLFIEQVKGY